MRRWIVVRISNLDLRIRANYLLNICIIFLKFQNVRKKEVGTMYYILIAEVIVLVTGSKLNKMRNNQ